jgi:hypothetical protein
VGLPHPGKRTPLATTRTFFDANFARGLSGKSRRKSSGVASRMQTMPPPLLQTAIDFGKKTTEREKKWADPVADDGYMQQLNRL